MNHNPVYFESEMQDGIYSCIKKSELKGENLKYANFYDSVAFGYELCAKIVYLFMFGRVDAVKNLILSKINPKKGDNVLEICTGSGTNLLAIDEEVNRYGLDISISMLKKAVRNAKSKGILAKWFHGNGENLPFENNSMDFVLNCGAINFFDNPKKSIEEMIRVAKPGATLVMADETDKIITNFFSYIPIVNKYFTGKKIVPPLAYIPPQMDNINLSLTRNGLMWVIRFQKPIETKAATDISLLTPAYTVKEYANVQL